MDPSAVPKLIAVDVGNSRIKIGMFDRVAGLPPPEPIDVIDLPIMGRSGRFNAAELDAWCNANVANGSKWFVGSVHRAAVHRLIFAVNDWARRSSLSCPLRQLTNADVPLTIRVDEPGRVGIDRLLAAFAAGRLRQRDRAAIIVDLGTAITVDLLEADGAFAGGAILPGVAMSAQALSDRTDALPHVNVGRLEKPPPALGKSTISAIESGVYWGMIGAIRELVSQLSAKLFESPELFLTGGASWQAVELFSADKLTVRHVPNLVLSGIALVNI
jgi:type III pantothenate kinase